MCYGSIVYLLKKERGMAMMKKETILVATMLFSMAVSATFVSAAEVYPRNITQTERSHLKQEMRE